MMKVEDGVHGVVVVGPLPNMGLILAIGAEFGFEHYRLFDLLNRQYGNILEIPNWGYQW